MRLHVFGSSGTRPGAGRACSSYLVEHDGYRLLLDCGNGSLANLEQRLDVAQVDAVLLSHLHPDHFADLYGLYYALRFHPAGPRSLPVHAPAGAGDFVAQLLHSDERFREHLQFRERAAGDEFDLGGLRVRLYAARHPIEALATRLEADGTVLCYTGDTGASAEIVEAARDADLLLCDATWLERDGPHPEGVHMTGAEAGTHASAAGVAALMVTHVYPTVDPDDVAAEAGTRFDGRLLVARDLEEHTL